MTGRCPTCAFPGPPIVAGATTQYYVCAGCGEAWPDGAPVFHAGGALPPGGEALALESPPMDYLPHAAAEALAGLAPNATSGPPYPCTCAECVAAWPDSVGPETARAMAEYPERIAADIARYRRAMAPWVVCDSDAELAAPTSEDV